MSSGTRQTNVRHDINSRHLAPTTCTCQQHTDPSTDARLVHAACPVKTGDFRPHRQHAVLDAAYFYQCNTQRIMLGTRVDCAKTVKLPVIRFHVHSSERKEPRVRLGSTSPQKGVWGVYVAARCNAMASSVHAVQS